MRSRYNLGVPGSTMMRRRFFMVPRSCVAGKNGDSLRNIVILSSGKATSFRTISVCSASSSKRICLDQSRLGSKAIVMGPSSSSACAVSARGPLGKICGVGGKCTVFGGMSVLYRDSRCCVIRRKSSCKLSGCSRVMRGKTNISSSSIMFR